MSQTNETGGGKSYIPVRDKRGKAWFWKNNLLYDEIQTIEGEITTFAAVLGPSACAVYDYLCRRADEETQTCFPAHPTIAFLCGITEPTVIESLHLLEDHGLISKQHRESIEGDPTSNMYTLLPVGSWVLGGGKSNLLPPRLREKQERKLEKNRERKVPRAIREKVQRGLSSTSHQQNKEDYGGNSNWGGVVNPAYHGGKSNLPPLDQYSFGQASVDQNSQHHLENENFSQESNVDDVDEKSLKNGKPPVIGQINASDVQLAKTNKRATQHNAAQTAADAGQPILSGATLSEVNPPENGAGAELLAQVLKIGVSARPAQALIAEFPDETARQAEYWPYQDRSKIPNPGGWFVAAVKGAYAAPPAYNKAKDAEMREENLRAQRIEDERQREAKRVQVEAEEQQNQELDAEFAQLSADEQKEADAKILEENPGIELLFQHQNAEGKARTLASYRRQLLRSGWEPGQSTSRFLDAQCSESALDAAAAQLPDEVTQEIETRIAKEFDEMGLEAKPDSKTWLSRKRGLLRQMLKSGVLQLPAQVKAA